MWDAKKSARLSVAACICGAAALLAVAVFGNRLFALYFIAFRGMQDPEKIRILRRTLAICVYPGCVLGIGALVCLIQLLRNIIRDSVFVFQNVQLLRWISWCCFLVAALTAYGSFYYPPLIFLTAAAGFVGLILRVVKNVMQNAVVLREENDLTI